MQGSIWEMLIDNIDVTGNMCDQIAPISDVSYDAVDSEFCWTCIRIDGHIYSFRHIPLD